SRQTNGDVLLVATMKIDALTQGRITLGMGYGKQQIARVPVDKALAKLPKDKWMQVGVPLKCFQQAGADMKHITAPFRLQATDGETLSVSKIALGTNVDHTVSCAGSPQ